MLPLVFSFPALVLSHVFLPSLTICHLIYQFYIINLQVAQTKKHIIITFQKSAAFKKLQTAVGKFLNKRGASCIYFISIETIRIAVSLIVSIQRAGWRFQTQTFVLHLSILGTRSKLLTHHHAPPAVFLLLLYHNCATSGLSAVECRPALDYIYCTIICANLKSAYWNSSTLNRCIIFIQIHA